MHHLLQLLAGNPLLRRGFSLDKLCLLDDIPGAEQQETFARQAVASGAARFLVVTLDVLRQIIMDHEADVRLVDAHAERDRGANHPDFVAQKQVLVSAPIVGLHSRMIRRGLDAVGIQSLGNALGALAALAVNDPAVFGPGANEGERLLVRPGFGADAIGEVGPVEAGDVTTRLAQFQQTDDIGAHALRCRGRQRHHRRLRKQIAHRGKLAVFRPKIMAPFADAMGLVNGEQIDVPLLQIGQKPGEQSEPAVVQPAEPPARLLRIKRRVQKRGRDAARLQRIHLVLHQGYERRDHYAKSGTRQRRHLETE